MDTQAIPAQPSRQGAKLNLSKCEFCRKDKQRVCTTQIIREAPVAPLFPLHEVPFPPVLTSTAEATLSIQPYIHVVGPDHVAQQHFILTTLKCEPVGREWPKKCTRCISKGYSCSPNTRKRKLRTLESLAKTPPPRLREALEATSVNQFNASVTQSNSWVETGSVTCEQLILW